MIAPAYTMTVAAARKGADCSRNSPQVLNVTIANHNAAYTGLRLVIMSTPHTSAPSEKIQNRIDSASGPVATCNCDASNPPPTSTSSQPPARDRGQLEGISHHTPRAISPSETSSNQF